MPKSRKDIEEVFVQIHFKDEAFITETFIIESQHLSAAEHAILNSWQSSFTYTDVMHRLPQRQLLWRFKQIAALLSDEMRSNTLYDTARFDSVYGNSRMYKSPKDMVSKGRVRWYFLELTGANHELEE